MLRIKFLAVLLAFWLPLFSGNALAASIEIRVKQIEGAAGQTLHKHCAATQHAVSSQADQHAAHPYQCGSCHLVCCGFLATAVLVLLEPTPSAQSYTPVVSQFQSISLTPLDPPPLVRC